MSSQAKLIILFFLSSLFLFHSQSLKLTSASESQEPAEKSHPTLVDVETAKCVTCHDDLKEKKFVHSVVADESCDACHELTKRDNKTFVFLAEEENALCLACHSDIEEAIGKKNPHPVVEEGCLSCHNPHSSEYSLLLRDKMDVLCANCHDILEDTFQGKHGRQPVALFGCGLCHNSHGSDEDKLLNSKFRHAPFEAGECSACHKRVQGRKIRLRGNGASLCYACHSDKETEFAKNSLHTPLKKDECSGCHNPHLANSELLLVKEGNALCVNCHGKVGALVKKKYVHAPVEDSCQSCHSPHAADYRFNLAEEATTLCLNCHDSNDDNFKSTHYAQKAENLKCTECHNPHGSDNETLLNTFPHPPFDEKACDTCHEDTKAGENIKLVEHDINTMCFSCHDDKANDDSKKNLVLHGALEAEACTVCHSPHASSRQHLLMAHSSRLCVSCHEQRHEEREKGQYIHGIIDTIGCEACHEPHFSKNKALLHEMPNALCLECHLARNENKEAGKKTITIFGKIKIEDAGFSGIKKVALSADQTRGHPRTGHRVSGNIPPDLPLKKKLRGLTFSGEMNCLSCHDSHAGLSPALFSDEIRESFRICLKCHKK